VVSVRIFAPEGTLEVPIVWVEPDVYSTEEPTPDDDDRTIYVGP
jgi:hypothetical protein